VAHNKWIEENNIVNQEQSGFRKNRTVDLCFNFSEAENRKNAIFIDFEKAFAKINQKFKNTIISFYISCIRKTNRKGFIN